MGTSVPQGGVQASSPTITLDDVWLDAPGGVPPGGAADLRLYAVNRLGSGDALTGVTSPLVRGAELCLGRSPTGLIELPADEAVDLEWGGSATVRLTGFLRPLPPASWIPITLHFAHSGSVTTQVVTGPLGAPLGSLSGVAGGPPPSAGRPVHARSGTSSCVGP